MTDEARRRASPLLPLTLAGRVDRACDGYEAEWKAGRRPRIEAYPGRGDRSPRRSALLRELLLLEIEFRRAIGERPTAGGVPGPVPRA